MESITIGHHDERGRTTYTVYTQEEADEAEIDYTPVNEDTIDDIQAGDYILILDRKYQPTVQKVIRRYEKPKTYFSVPQGNFFFYSGGFSRLGLQRGKKSKKKQNYITKPSEQQRKAFIWNYITTFDSKHALEAAFPRTVFFLPRKIRKKVGEQILEKDIVKKDIYNQMQSILKKKDMNLEKIAELIEETLDVAREEGQAATMLKTTQYMAKLLGVSTDSLKVKRKFIRQGGQGIREVTKEETNAQQGISGNMSELSESDYDNLKEGESIETTVEASREGGMSSLSNDSENG